MRLKSSLNLFLVFSIISILFLSFFSETDLAGIYSTSKIQSDDEAFKERTPEENKIKLAGFWDDVAFIHVKNDNWSETSLPWIQVGVGTPEDPHIIENVTIDASSSPIGSGILIESSSDYFIIRNCTIHGAKGGYLYHGGIKLDSSNNGTLIDNNLSNNDVGIYLYSSNNNTISGNNASNNNYFGIRLDFSHNNTISGNNANDNYYGIELYSSNNNTISGNNANDNDYGIDLTYSNNNTISRNNANDNDYGIYLFYSNNNTISRNNATNNIWDGIVLFYSNNNTISNNMMRMCGISINGFDEEHFSSHVIKENKVNEKWVYYYKNEVGLNANNFTDAGQVILVNCNDSFIKNLNLSHGSTGVFLYGCSNNVLKDIIASHNNWLGIVLFYSNNNTISGNNATNNNSVGIGLYYSNNNTISGNNAIYNNLVGIGLYCSHNNTISGNNATNNNLVGIGLDCSHNNTISGNNASNNNEYGIELEESNYNQITRNTLLGNGEKCILELNCVGNNISGNICEEIGEDLLFKKAFERAFKRAFERAFKRAFERAIQRALENVNSTSMAQINVMESSDRVIKEMDVAFSNLRGVKMVFTGYILSILLDVLGIFSVILIVKNHPFCQSFFNKLYKFIKFAIY
ncbi:MAG: right-handed parallel beta-helix repeat-containing protein [Promethearchaeota archaeon]